MEEEKKQFPSRVLAKDNLVKLNFLAETKFRNIADNVKITNMIYDYIIRKKDDITVSETDGEIKIIDRIDRYE